MAGDTLRDAFRARLVALAGQSPAVTLAVKDLVNTTELPDASVSFLALEFIGGSEDQYTFGIPGHNRFLEIGQVTLRVCAPIGSDRDTCEAAAEILRNRFRNDSFAAGNRTIRIVDTTPMGGGQDEGGLWVESIGLRYRVFNTG
jgi:hypothetical protein